MKEQRSRGGRKEREGWREGKRDGGRKGGREEGACFWVVTTSQPHQGNETATNAFLVY